MSAKKREVSTESVSRHDSPSSFVEHARQREQEQVILHQALENELALLEPCTCLPLFTSTPALLPQTETSIADTMFVNEVSIVPTTQQFNHVLRTHLKHLLLRSVPLSVLILHVSQLEQPTLSTEREDVYQRRRYHVSQNVLAQILNKVQRALRSQDQLLVEEGVGAAMLFPAVDEQGIQNIVERVYQSIYLLQAETIVPPLLRVTDIVLGCGTYARQNFFQHDSEQAIEELLKHTGCAARRLILRPALATSLWETMPHVESRAAISTPSQYAPEHSADSEREAVLMQEEHEPYEHQEKPHLPLPPSPLRQASKKKEVPIVSHLDVPTSVHPTLSPTQAIASIPFLHLPSKLSPRLKHLIPYSLACQLQCAPVGRDHHTLTVAMADPTDNHALQRLQESTGMTIFPVSCNPEALAALLAERW